MVENNSKILKKRVFFKLALAFHNADKQTGDIQTFYFSEFDFSDSIAYSKYL